MKNEELEETRVEAKMVIDHSNEENSIAEIKYGKLTDLLTFTAFIAGKLLEGCLENDVDEKEFMSLVEEMHNSIDSTLSNLLKDK